MHECNLFWQVGRLTAAQFDGGSRTYTVTVFKKQVPLICLEFLLITAQV